MSPTPEIYTFPSTDAISSALDHFLTHESAKAIAHRGKFTISLSGGSLPKVLGAEIKANKYIDWSKWHVFFADERCVPLDHEDSNYLLAKENLLDHVPIPKDQVYTIDPKLVKDPEAAAKAYQKVLAAVFGSETDIPSLDVNLLGLGPDGHCCSLFPGHPLLGVTDRWVAAIHDSPKPPKERITLTFPVVNEARINLFVANGEGKAEVLHKVLDKKEDLPSGRVTGKERLIWFLDASAAKHVTSKAQTYKL
ncbi:uncharacterized protein EV422DRAFT_620588 [Fimicolochytrium jonesii]|uniref:uncharacterized protein n=1 Tax=Fimicolochytrium jonesii TaxID=1396493 RepID=UPI0022FDB1E4|nr:uncharacterized protein EV422DRAFT_620588 [Fimicolochytrium jonesii]KAI8820197.1 hypothetical protein EV422DRAFT_620588 [Fimicolochytrium jonesii]